MSMRCGAAPSLFSDSLRSVRCHETREGALRVQHFKGRTIGSRCHPGNKAQDRQEGRLAFLLYPDGISSPSTVSPGGTIDMALRKSC